MVKDLVEGFHLNVKGKTIPTDEYKQMLTDLCNKAGNRREKSKILFDARRRMEANRVKKEEIERCIDGVKWAFRIPRIFHLTNGWLIWPQ